MYTLFRSISLRVALCLTPLVALADTAGNYESSLIEAMHALSSGECPATLFAEPLKSNCEQQLSKKNHWFTQLGSLKQVAFEGVQPLRGREGKVAESYKVTFENGDWVWYIDVASDGKIQTLWAPHKPNFGATVQ